jgi:hypothetical protein
MDIRGQYILSFTESIMFDIKILHFGTLHQLPIPYFATTMSNLSQPILPALLTDVFQRFVA